jgi:hypothetical protein
MQVMRAFRLSTGADGRILHASDAFSKGAREMEMHLTAPLLALDSGQVVTLDDAAGHSISTRSGTVWVTEEGQRKDYIVGPGEVLVVQCDGRTVVQALQASWISIQ